MNETKQKMKEIFLDDSEFKIWEHLDNGCSIATMGYSKENILKLMPLLKSFEEQYGEVIDYTAAMEELKLYQDMGKLFIYLDEQGNPVSMNGCIYDYQNETVGFQKKDSEGEIHSLYYYGLSTIPTYRGKGACSTLIEYSMKFAEANGFDIIYARTDLIGSNSENIMKKHGMQICLDKNMIIAEWVDVTQDQGDYRLHMYKPLKDGIEVYPTGDFVYAENTPKRKIINKYLIPSKSVEKKLILTEFPSTSVA